MHHQHCCKAHFTMCKPQISRQGSAISKGCLEYPPISQGRGGNGVGWSPVGVGGGVANCSGWSCVSELHVLTPSSGLPAWLVRLCLSFAWRLFPPDFLLGLVAQPHNPGMFTGAFTTRKPFVYIHWQKGILNHRDFTGCKQADKGGTFSHFTQKNKYIYGNFAHTGSEN